MTSLFEFDNIAVEWRIPHSNLVKTSLEVGHIGCGRWRYSFIDIGCNTNIDCDDCPLDEPSPSSSIEIPVLVLLDD